LNQAEYLGVHSNDLKYRGSGALLQADGSAENFTFEGLVD
jgi:hypothetical protein